MLLLMMMLFMMMIVIMMMVMMIAVMIVIVIIIIVCGFIHHRHHIISYRDVRLKYLDISSAQRPKVSIYHRWLSLSSSLSSSLIIIIITIAYTILIIITIIITCLSLSHHFNSSARVMLGILLLIPHFESSFLSPIVNGSLSQMVIIYMDQVW
jgi:hypothetical protein